MRCYRCAWTQLHQVVDNHLVAGFQATKDDPVLAAPFAELHRARRNLVFGAGQHDHRTLFGLDHGRLRDEEDTLAFAGEQANADELAGQQLIVGIVEFGTQLLGAERGIDITGQEIQLARIRINLAIRQDQLNTGHVLARQAAVRELGQIAFTKAEADPQRIHLVNRGQQAIGTDADQVAFRLGSTAGCAADRGQSRSSTTDSAQPDAVRSGQLHWPKRRHRNLSG